MRQPRRNKPDSKTPKRKATKKTSSAESKDSRMPKLSKPTKSKPKHQQFGTSKLEQDFARDFLDKLGVEYIWQFEAKEIKRFFDYYLVNQNLIIEVNGTYWHGDSRVYEGKELTNTQKKNQRVDEYKRRWALLHGIPIIYVWEKDIRENPGKVMEFLKSKILIEGEKMQIFNEKMKKRHINHINNKNNKEEKS